jgi:hypothetical protein
LLMGLLASSPRVAGSVRFGVRPLRGLQNERSRYVYTTHARAGLPRPAAAASFKASALHTKSNLRSGFGPFLTDQVKPARTVHSRGLMATKPLFRPHSRYDGPGAAPGLGGGLSGLGQVRKAR